MRRLERANPGLCLGGRHPRMPPWDLIFSPFLVFGLNVLLRAEPDVFFLITPRRFVELDCQALETGFDFP